MMAQRSIRSIPVACFILLKFVVLVPGVLADTHYVSPSGSHIDPFKTWATAATNIQAAVDAAESADTVLVTNGLYDAGTTVTPGYACFNRVVITKDVEIRSVNGRDVTIIKGAEATGGGNGADAVRGVYMTAGALFGFTITNGHTMTSGSSFYDRSGGGVNMADGAGRATNCTLSGNSAALYGGGSYAGMLSNCTLSNNFAESRGGGNYAGTLSDCTISDNSSNDGGGSFGGKLENCTISDNSADNGGGSYGEMLNNCILSNNSANYGGGTYQGTLSECMLSENWATNSGGGGYYSAMIDCTLSGNSAEYQGGGARSGSLTNCLLYGNTAEYGGGSAWSMLANCAVGGNCATSGGGGTYYGELNNCTISGNTATNDGGGSLGGTLNNCIVYHNTAGLGGDNHSGGATMSYSCTTPNPGGTGNITADPALVSISHILAASPCAGAGSTNYASGTDIDGEVWSAPPSIGCDEPLAPFQGQLYVAIVAAYTNVEMGDLLALSADISGDEVGSNGWTFGDGASQPNAVYVQHAWSNFGAYDVVLTAYNDDNPGGVSATTQVQVLAPTNYYVDIANAWPVPPYTSWAAAATNIQDAVDEAAKAPGSTVWVADGVYDAGATVTPGRQCLNRVVITNDMLVRSANGPDTTIIMGAEASGGGNGSNAVRGVYLGAGVLSGFTITNGHTMTTGTQYGDPSGGGISMYDGSGGTLANCIVSGNSAHKHGGGVTYGTVDDCEIYGNSAGEDAGGLFNVAARNSTINGNYAGISGGGTRAGSLTDCVISSNSAVGVGGGTYYSDLTRCTVSDNSVSNAGGGTYFGTLINCRITGNSATNNGGGTYFGTLTHCTISGNSAGNSGGGMYQGSLTSGIIYYNHSPAASNFYITTADALNYCCTARTNSTAVGTGCVADEPLFMNRAGGDYLLLYGSPCIDSGSPASSTTNDLDGTLRPLDGDFDGTNRHDMGCYEYDGSATDSDNDGLMDADEVVTYGTSPTDTDTDGDHADDYAETIADTDGTNAGDYFRITSVESTNSCTVTFVCTNSRVYGLQFNTNLITGQWSPVTAQTNILGEPDGQMSFTDTNDANRRAYRVQVELP